VIRICGRIVWLLPLLAGFAQTAGAITLAAYTFDDPGCPGGQHVNDGPYFCDLIASGGTGTYTFSIVSGADTIAFVSGAHATAEVFSPTVGTHSLTVQVADSTNATATATFTYTIYPILTIASTSPLPAGQVGVSYPTALSASGGKLPYVWSLDSGALPPGMFLTSDGHFAFAPTAAGTYNFVARVYDNNGPCPNYCFPSATVTRSFSITILSPAPLSITGPASLPSGAVGVAYGPVTFTASGGTGGYNWSATGLPNGLSISTGGVLSGTAAAGSSGSYTPQFTVRDSSNNNTSVTLLLPISPPPLAISSPASLSSATAGVAYGPVPFSASGGIGPYTWSASGLPNGLAFSTSGVLSGTPSTPGNYVPQFTVKDSTGNAFQANLTQNTASVTLPLTILPPALKITSPSSLSSGTVGLAYPTVTFTASGGTGNYTWSATGLPSGLGINLVTGVLSGTPAAGVQGSFSPQFTVMDSGSATASVTLSLTIFPPGLNITSPSSLSSGTVGVAYAAVTFTASGGTGSYTWSATGLPNGLTISPIGLLSGTPGAGSQGPYNPQFTVKDSSNATTSITLPLTVSVPPLTITCNAPSGASSPGTAFSATCTAAGGTSAYSWTYSGLPSGISGGASGTTVIIAGTVPNPPPNTYTATVTVTDSSSPTKQSKSQTITITISSGVSLTLTISCPAFSAAIAGSGFSTSCTASGGTPGYSWSYSGLPSWLSGGTSGTTVALSGTPPSPPPASYSLTVTVTDSGSPTKLTASQSITISVSPPVIQGVTITQSNSGAAPNQTNLLVQLGQPAATNYTGTLSLNFIPDPSVTNVPATYVDPAAGFPVGGQGTTGMTQNFSMNQGQTQASVQFGQGTVAGIWTVTLTALNPGGVPSPTPSFSVPIALAAPVITPGSVKIVFNSANSGFTVQLSGVATTRDVSSATFVFTPAGGGTLTGSTVTVPFSGQDQSQWFNTNAGRSAGGTFSLAVPFTYSGDPNALGSVAVTLTNSKGTSVVLTGSK